MADQPGAQSNSFRSARLTPGVRRTGSRWRCGLRVMTDRDALLAAGDALRPLVPADPPPWLTAAAVGPAVRELLQRQAWWDRPTEVASIYPFRVHSDFIDTVPSTATVMALFQVQVLTQSVPGFG